MFNTREAHDIAYLAASIIDLMRQAIKESEDNDNGEYSVAAKIAHDFARDFIVGPRCCQCSPLPSVEDTAHE